MSVQSTSNILMIRPSGFRSNEETMVSNHFQQVTNEGIGIADDAIREFNGLVELLKSKEINVMIADYSPAIDTPDRIFPNNWISFDENGTAFLYPMSTPNRRQERRSEVLELLHQNRFQETNLVDFTIHEQSNRFLEGTGSLVLDRIHKIAYAALSERTDPLLVITFCETAGYKACAFRAFHSVMGKRLPVYHTNVMLCIGTKLAIICIDSIDDPDQKKQVLDSLSASRSIVEISEDQMSHFAGNMLEVKNKKNELFLVMSSSAFNTLHEEQVKRLTSFYQILHTPLNTIEKFGGGSARCMLAEVFLPQL